MPSWRIRLLLLGSGVAALAAAIPAVGQQGTESALPPGFGAPPAAPAPPPKEQAPAAPPVLTNEITEAPRARPRPPRRTVEALPVEEGAIPPEEQGAALLPADLFVVPEGARRPVDVVGVLRANWGLGFDGFGRADGRFLATLMRQADVPLPSRWASMLVRRALLTRAPAPPNIHPVDWVAERAWLLLRMGEADAARMLVQSVDLPNYTPRMVIVAREAALATADISGLCPLVEPGRALNREPVWTLTEAMCAALEGEAARAGILIDQSRRRGPVGGIDLALAEKVVGAGTDSRRAVTLEWDQVNALNPWRLGLAAATGAEIPSALLRGAPAHLRAWAARAPMLPVEQRLEAAHAAATLGVFSSADLNEMYALVFDGGAAADEENAGGPEATAERLRTAWIDRSRGERLEALRALWNNGGDQDTYARLILTAGAAARVPPSAQAAARDVDLLLASMLAAGFDQQAARWAPAVAERGENGQAWALLAVGAPAPAVEVSAAAIEDFAASDKSRGDHRSALLLASLAGLGRISPDELNAAAEELGVSLQRQDAWTRAITEAARNRQPATMALLAATGMQSGSWDGVSPAYLFHMLRALRAVGLDYEARMIAAEAVTRA